VRSVRKPFWGYPRSGGSDSAPKESLIAGNSPISAVCGLNIIILIVSLWNVQLK
jgi:hypothetical protein